jgi:ATP-binding cassette subfamily B protein
MTTLKAFNASKTRGKKLEKQAWAMHRSTMRNLTVSLVESGILQFGAMAGSVLSIGVGVLRAANGAFPAEEMVFILFLVTSCFAPVYALINAWHLGFRGMSASPLIFELLYAQEQRSVFLDESAGAQEKDDPQAMRVEFDRVTFGYMHERPAVLNDITLDIPNGKTTALVGRSGSGKSTVLNLLCGFYPAWQGDIKICGKSIGSYTETELRSLIGVVWQEPYLFYGTILDNILMARPSATMEQVAEAAKNAQIHEFIAALPAGYETLVGERGMRLSGGEKQRIAIARCFLRDPQLIIFDEATANLDGENEEKMQQSMRTLTQRKTTLIVAHRLSTILDADQVYVLDNGMIVQTGRHDELMAQPGVYQTLMLNQWEVMRDV